MKKWRKRVTRKAFLDKAISFIIFVIPISIAQKWAGKIIPHQMALNFFIVLALAFVTITDKFSKKGK